MSSIKIRLNPHNVGEKMPNSWQDIVIETMLGRKIVYKALSC